MLSCADTLAQQYLFGKTKAVVVYHMFESSWFGMRGFLLAGNFKVMQNAMNK